MLSDREKTSNICYIQTRDKQKCYLYFCNVLGRIRMRRTRRPKIVTTTITTLMPGMLSIICDVRETYARMSASIPLCLPLEAGR